MKRVLMALAGVLALSACTSEQSDFATGADSAVMSESAVESDRAQVIRTGSLTLVVSDVTESADEAIEVVLDAGGRIDSRDVLVTDNGPMTTLTTRIPADNFDEVLSEVSQLGEVTSLYENSADVTMQVIDLDARISTLTESISRLRDLQQQAATVADLVAVETELTTRQAELESLQSQRTYLADQVDYSTLTITFNPEVSRTTGSPDFVNGLINGWYALLNLGASALTGLGFVIPFLIPLVILIFVVRVIRKRKRVG